MTQRIDGGDFLSASRVKTSWLAEIWFGRAGVEGMFNPFGHEPLISSSLLHMELPFVISHELAHARGIADEGDANLVALLATIASDDPHLQYSGWMHLWLHLRDRERDALLDPGPAADVAAIYERMRAAQVQWAIHLQSAVLDLHLKAHDVPEGLRVTPGLSPWPSLPNPAGEPSVDLRGLPGTPENGRHKNADQIDARHHTREKQHRPHITTRRDDGRSDGEDQECILQIAQEESCFNQSDPAQDECQSGHLEDQSHRDDHRGHQVQVTRDAGQIVDLRQRCELRLKYNKAGCNAESYPRSRNEADARGDQEGEGISLLVAVKSRFDKSPHLPQDEWRGEYMLPASATRK